MTALIYAFVYIVLGLLFITASRRGAGARIDALQAELNEQAARLLGWIDTANKEKQRADRLQQEAWQSREQEVAALRAQASKEEIWQARYEKLAIAIRQHRDAKGPNRCWLNDRELYAALGDNVPVDRELPCLPEFMMECVRYWQTYQAAAE